VNYDNTVLAVDTDVDGCTTEFLGACNPTFDENTVSIAMIDANGLLSGVVASIRFTATAGAGTTTPLDLVVINCNNEMAAPLTCVDSDGSIDIAAATPSPTPSPSPGPSPTPPPLIWGDVDCSGAVNAIDSLATQRWKVGLPYNSAPGCPQIGVPLLPTLWGDTNCDSAVNAIDALALQRWKVGLPVNQTQPCPVIGQPHN
jgi:hypothetical protein